MFACSFLDRDHNMPFDTIGTDDVIDLLLLFTNSSYPRYIEAQYIYKYGIRITEILKEYRCMRQDYLRVNMSEEHCLPLKKVFPIPNEIKSLSSLLKYVVHNACIGFYSSPNSFQDDLWKLELSSRALLLLLKFFKTALQDPLLVNVTAQSIMDVMEAVVYLGWDHQDSKELDGDVEDCLKNVNNLLLEFCDENVNISWLFMIRYKARIDKIQSLVKRNFVRNFPMIDKIIYTNDSTYLNKAMS